jgi:hypothetical protein
MTTPTPQPSAEATSLAADIMASIETRDSWCTRDIALVAEPHLATLRERAERAEAMVAKLQQGVWTQ